jgi:hypothetical protein
MSSLKFHILAKPAVALVLGIVRVDCSIEEFDRSALPAFFRATARAVECCIVRLRVGRGVGT